MFTALRFPAFLNPDPYMSLQAIEPASGGDSTAGLCPLEALLQEKSDVTALETPMEWYCTDLRALRDVMLGYLRVEVVRREVRRSKTGLCLKRILISKSCFLRPSERTTFRRILQGGSSRYS